MPHTPDNRASLQYPPVRPYGPRHKMGTIVLTALIFFAGICVLTAGTTIRVLIADLSTYSTLNKGQRTEAGIIGRRIEDNPDKTYFYLTYQFELDGESFEKDAAVDDFLYEVYKEGTTVTVVYLPEEPSNSMLETSLQRELAIARIVTIIIPIMFVGFPALLLLVWWWLFRRLPAKLRKHGVATTGTIIDCWNEGQGQQHMIAYTFHAKGAAEPIGGKEQLPDSAPILTTGDTIGIRYLTKKPGIFMLEWERT